MKIHEPMFLPKNWVEHPRTTYLTNVPVLPTGNIAWWVRNDINFVWELPTSLHAHGWWINAMILRELGTLIATKQHDGSDIIVNETQIMVTKPDKSVDIARSGSRCCSDVTRGFIIVKSPETREDAVNQIAEVVCNKFHQISNFNAIYPRTVRYDHF